MSPHAPTNRAAHCRAHLPPGGDGTARVASPAQLEELKKLSIEELAETDVTGSGRAAEQLDEIAAAVSVITSDDFVAMA